MRKFYLMLLLPLALMACGAAEPVWAPDEAVRAAVHRADGPKTLTLFTMVSNRSNSGAHSGLMVNGSQRVIFDPAGTFRHPRLPERNDVHFGITDRVIDVYVDYHARETYHVVVQTIEVSDAVAERALRLVQEYGAVPKAHCTNSITTVLRQLPGFEGLKHTWFPGAAMKQFATLPGVSERKVYDDSPDDRSDIGGVGGTEGEG